MFKIIKENKVLGIVSNPTWVRMQDNGCYGLTIEDNSEWHGVSRQRQA